MEILDNFQRNEWQLALVYYEAVDATGSSLSVPHNSHCRSSIRPVHVKLAKRPGLRARVTQSLEPLSVRNMHILMTDSSKATRTAPNRRSELMR